MHRATLQARGYTALGSCKQGHRHERDGRKRDADVAGFRAVLQNEIANRTERDISRQCKKTPPTSLRAVCSRCCPIEPSCNRQRSTALEKSSITESAPKPTSAMLPARIPEGMPTAASTPIQATLRYSSKRPCLMAASCGVSVPFCVCILAKDALAPTGRAHPRAAAMVDRSAVFPARQGLLGGGLDYRHSLEMRRNIGRLAWNGIEGRSECQMQKLRLERLPKQNSNPQASNLPRQSAKKRASVRHLNERSSSVQPKRASQSGKCAQHGSAPPAP